MVEYIEADFAQLEHINQIIYNNRTYKGYTCFDTGLFLEQVCKDADDAQFAEDNGYSYSSNVLTSKYGRWDTKNLDGSLNNRIDFGVLEASNIRYNDLLVSWSVDPVDDEINGYAGFTTFTITVHNSLWTGNWCIMVSDPYGAVKEKQISNGTYDESNFTFEQKYILASKVKDKENTIQIRVTDPLKTDSKGNIVRDENGKAVSLTDKRTHVRICFELSLSGSGCDITDDASIRLECADSYEHQYDKSVTEEGYVYMHNGDALKNATVSIQPCNSMGSILTDGIPSATVTTDKNGRFLMPYGVVSAPDTYYCYMTASYMWGGVLLTTEKIITVVKTQRETFGIVWDENDYDGVYKGCIHTYNPIQILVNNRYGLHENEGWDEYEKLKDIPITVSFVSALGDVKSETYYVEYDSVNDRSIITPTISYRRYYENTSYLRISIPSYLNTPALVEQHRVKHVWRKATDWSDLKSEVTNSTGCDWIFLYPKIYTAKGSIEITREITIAGMVGDDWATIDGTSTHYNLFKINNSNASSDFYMHVQFLGFKLMNGNPAINMSTGCRLMTSRCYFTSNFNSAYNHVGCSIQMPVTDSKISQHKLWKLEVVDCTFYNSRGNEIQSIGTTLIHSSFFKTDSSSYLLQPNVKVVNVMAGEVTYKNNRSYINTGKTPMASNHSYAKALTYVNTGAKFNGRGPSQLKGDNTCKLFGSPYNNKAYTYTIYYYPYDTVKTKIVCSPKKGYEYKATGHGSSAKNWIYYDGYDFVRWNNGANYGNTNNPWTDSEKAIPSNRGIYAEDSNTFTKGYNPLTSNNSSLNSELD